MEKQEATKGKEAKKPLVQLKADIIEKQTYIDEKGEQQAINYVPPQKQADSPLTQFDYARLRGDSFDKYFELVEGKIDPRTPKRSHTMPTRSIGGLNRNKKYLFSKYRAVPIKEKIGDIFEITGVQLLNTVPENVGLRFTLNHAITLNHYLGDATTANPTSIYLLDQTQEL